MQTLLRRRNATLYSAKLLSTPRQPRLLCLHILGGGRQHSDAGQSITSAMFQRSRLL